MKRIIMAVTGASGAVYARQMLEMLTDSQELEEIAVIISDKGREVMRYEGQDIAGDDPRVIFYDNNDMFAPPASGSAGYDAMIVIPCSVGSVGRMAAGVSFDLIGRAADVMMKERRKLILVVRETPFSTIHLRNLTTLSECGAVIMPASPSFYSHPADMEELCATVTERVMKLIGINADRYVWGEK